MGDPHGNVLRALYVESPLIHYYEKKEKRKKEIFLNIRYYWTIERITSMNNIKNKNKNKNYMFLVLVKNLWNKKKKKLQSVGESNKAT